MRICQMHKSSSLDLDQYGDYVKSLINHVYKNLAFDKPFKLMFISDKVNSEGLFGKTAFYAPEQETIVIHTHGRHPKDILRSLAHEMVHHFQNCANRIDTENDYSEGYTQKSDDGRQNEEEAYLKGNMMFRDWEDDQKKRTRFKDTMNKYIHKPENSEDDEIDEFTTTANIAGYTLPLGASNFDPDPESRSRNK